MRLKSEKPEARATIFLASSTVASRGSSTEGASFLMGFLGTRLVSLRESSAAMVGGVPIVIIWVPIPMRKNRRKEGREDREKNGDRKRAQHFFFCCGAITRVGGLGVVPEITTFGGPIRQG